MVRNIYTETVSKSKAQPIIGTQINFNFDNNIGLLTLIAMSEKGYKNMVKLSSSTYINNNDNLEQPNCKIEDLFHFNEDIIVLSGANNSILSHSNNGNITNQSKQLIETLKSSFPNNFYLVIQRILKVFENNQVMS